MDQGTYGPMESAAEYITSTQPSVVEISKSVSLAAPTAPRFIKDGRSGRQAAGELGNPKPMKPILALQNEPSEFCQTMMEAP